MSNKQPTEFREHNNYPIVKAWTIFAWECPECFNQNTVHRDTYIIQRGVDECMKCERAVNVMAPAPDKETSE